MKNKNFYHVDWTRSLFLAMEAWWKLAWAAVRIRIPFGRQKLVQRAMSAGAMTRPACRVDPIQTVSLVKAVERACHAFAGPTPMQPCSMATSRPGESTPPVRWTCLEQSLALVWMLRRRGLAATLQIGCRRDGPEFRFHAWVAGWDGTPLESSDIENRFAPFASLSCRSGFPA